MNLTSNFPKHLALLAVVALMLLSSITALAHPMGNFSINHYSGIRVERSFVEIRYFIDMAEIPTFQEMQKEGLTTKPDDASVQRYLTRQGQLLRKGLTLTLNDHPLDLRTVSQEIVFPPGAGGLATTKMGFVYRAEVPETAQAGIAPAGLALYYRDDNFPERIGWKETVATSGPGIKLIRASVPLTSRSSELSDYPIDLLNSPPQVLEARIVFAPEPLAVNDQTPPPLQEADRRAEVSALSSDSQAHFRESAQRPPRGSSEAGMEKTDRRSNLAGTPSITTGLKPTSGPPADARTSEALIRANRQSSSSNRLAKLMTDKRAGMWFLVLAAAIAAGLGALHALEPGHGKTIVAAYLVGSKGTAYHAFLLGMIVTISHTAGVYALGAVTLYASRYIVPERLYPWLGAVSGLMIAALGSFLFLRRYAGHEVGHSHGPGGHHHHHHSHGGTHVHGEIAAPTHNAHEHPHGVQEHHHHHGESHYEHEHGHHHHHHHAVPDNVSYKQLLALGITGGMVPCPAALVVLLSAVALNRVAFGLFLIVAFSIGLAGVLIGVGLLMVYARKYMTHLKSDGVMFTRWLPLTSAAVITVLGMAVTVRSLMTAGILQIKL